MDKCFACKKKTAEGVDLQRCTKCKVTAYCDANCQKADWKKHRPICKTDSVWYDKYRGPLNDQSYHFGKLELITWSYKDKYGTELGWGNCLAEESDDLKKRFEEEMGGEEEKLYDEWPQAFRWTCCGMDAEMEHGCDHHGTGPAPCTCDFCRMGEPLPDKIYFDKDRDGPGRDLQLARGPDLRSFHVGIGSVAAMARGSLGLDM